MKTTPRNNILHVTLAVTAALLTVLLTAQAQVTKGNNSINLNLGTSYVGGVAPTSSDVINIDSTVTGATSVSLGGNVTAAGINMTNPGGQFQINNTANATLQLGASGVTVTGGTAFNLVFNAAVVTTATQTWNVATGRVIQFANGTGSSLTETGGAVSITGAGAFDYRGGVGSVSGVISTVGTSGSVLVNGANALLTLGGTANTFTDLRIQNGRVLGSTLGNFGVSSSFGTGGTNTAITVGGSSTNGVLEYTGTTASSNRTVSRDARSVASGITVTNAGTTLTLSGAMGSGNNLNAAGSGWIFSGSGNLTLQGAITNSSNATVVGTRLTKNGSGVLTLNTTSKAYTGDTVVNVGTLIVNTTVTGTPNLTVASGAIIGGNGTIGASGGTSIISGIAAPGNSIGTLNIGNDTTWNFNNNWTFELGASAVSLASANSGSSTQDLLNITGNFSKGTGTTFTFDFLGTGATGFYKIVDWTGSSTFASGDFQAVNLAGGNSGIFTVDAGTSALYVQVIPEPSTSALLLAALGAVSFLRRRLAR